MVHANEIRDLANKQEHISAVITTLTQQTHDKRTVPAVQQMEFTSQHYTLW